MGQTLTHGVYLPNEGERNCYSGLASNWRLLDGAIGTVAAHTTAIAGKASASHTHGNISSDGKVGSTANLPLITGTGGVVQAGAFGNQANTFCEGNDSRLSDARTPVAHTHTKSDVTDLLNSNFIPSANNSYDLGSSSYQWNNLYAKNYYYNGTAWGLDKSNWWSQVQFYAQNSIHVRNVEPGVAPSSDVTAGIRVENANATYAFADIVAKVFTSGITFVNLIASNKFSNGALDPNGTSVSRGLQVGIRPDGTGFIYTDCGWRSNLSPHPLESGVANLGTSSLKWATLNGINPGALGLPSGNYDPINTNGWDLTGATGQSYTPTVNGWLFIAIQNIAGNYLSIVSGRGAISIDGTGAQGGLRAALPVIANESVIITVKTGAIFAARFYPMQGNVS